MEKTFICANWKMNTDIQECKNICNGIKNHIDKLNENIIIVLNVPFTHILTVSETFKNYKNIKIGAQNIHHEESGAFTGEISGKMLSSLNVDYVIIGHSERRRDFFESDKLINKKIKSALKNNIRPILCIGETLEEKQQNIEKEVLKRQIETDLRDIDDLDKVIVAYEPIWTIGTINAMNAKEANDLIRYLKNDYKLNILYGGSVNEENIVDFLSPKIIDGVLIGKASINVESFINILKKI